MKLCSKEHQKQESLENFEHKFSKLICTYVFYLTTGPHVWIQFLFTFPIFCFIFILPPTPFSSHSRFCLVFSCYFQPLWLAGMQPGQHPIFLFFYSLDGINFQFYFVYKSSLSMLCHQMLTFAMGSNFHTVHPRQPQLRVMLCTLHQFINCIQGSLSQQFCEKIQQSNLACTKYSHTYFQQSPQDHLK